MMLRTILLLLLCSFSAPSYSGTIKPTNTLLKNGLNAATYAEFNLIQSTLSLGNKQSTANTLGLSTALQLARLPMVSLALGVNVMGFRDFVTSSIDRLTYIYGGAFFEIIAFSDWWLYPSFKYGYGYSDYRFDSGKASYLNRTRGTFGELTLLTTITKTIKITLSHAQYQQRTYEFKNLSNNDTYYEYLGKDNDEIKSYSLGFRATLF